MALVQTCDGCNSTGLPKGLDERGPLARVYCADCLEAIVEYETARDALHDKVAATWQKGFAKIRKDHALSGVLPDE